MFQYWGNVISDYNSNHHGWFLSWMNIPHLMFLVVQFLVFTDSVMVMITPICHFSFTVLVNHWYSHTDFVVHFTNHFNTARDY